MELPKLPPDFKEFLKLLNDEKVDYLLIGGYVVGYYGYPRTTADMDVWVRVDAANAHKLVRVLRNFGMDAPELNESMFLEPGKIIRMGAPPMRLELHTQIDGVDFSDCAARKKTVQFEGININIISFEDLIANKKASGRYKDLDDLENLPEQL